MNIQIQGSAEALLFFVRVRKSPESRLCQTLRFSKGVGDGLHLCGSEGACTAVVAEFLQAFGESGVEAYPQLQLHPGRLRLDAGTVELCQLRASVLPYGELSLLHHGCKDSNKFRQKAVQNRKQREITLYGGRKSRIFACGNGANV